MVAWRESFQIHEINLQEIQPLIDSHVAYVSKYPDKKGRTIIYVHINRNIKINPQVFLKFLMYTVEW